MSTILVPLSTGLHILATVVFVGYYFFTGLIYLPVLEQCMNASVLRGALEHASARLRPFFGGSLLIFLVTGTYLMLINQNYQGLGNFFANPWSALIVIKHVLVLAFLVIAVSSERAFMGKISEQEPQALKRFRGALNLNTLLGVVIILMTSAAQAG
jgi:uncharacterized membrane protein